MITNERQYRITQAHAERFRTAIAAAETVTHDDQKKPIDPRLRKLTVDGMRAQLKELEKELRAYDKLKDSGGTQLEGDLKDLGVMLNQARIVQGWSQKKLAELL